MGNFANTLLPAGAVHLAECLLEAVKENFKNKAMKEYLKQTMTKIGIVATIIVVINYYNNDYMEFKDRKCIVLDKMTTTGGYKSWGDFYLVLKEEKGIVFDLIVSPATFSQSKIGDTKYFNLRQLEIKQTPMNNAIYFLGSVIFGTIGFVCLIGGWVFLKFSSDDDN